MIGIRLRRRALAVATGLALTIGLVSCAPDGQVAVDAPALTDSALAADPTAQIEAAVESAMTATGSTGAIVGVWVPWGGSYVAALGTDADGKKLDADMGIRIGDMTRLMTCDVLYSVAADGIVKIDDPVSTYVAGVPDLENVSLRQLCDGSSGLGASSSVVEGSWLKNPTRVWEPLELAAHGLAQPRATPGTTYRDSDAGYVLLGLALERATGDSYATLVKQRVFDPLGMGDSAYPPATELTPNVGVGPMPGYLFDRVGATFECSAPKDVTERSSSIGFADAGVVSTIRDLGRYLRALGVDALARGDAAEQRWANALPVRKGAPDWNTVGGGGVRASTLIGQVGATPGYLTGGFVDRETGMVVAISLNNSSAGADVVTPLAWQLASIGSKVPATSGQTAPEVGLPWTAEQWGQAIAASPLPCA